MPADIEERLEQTPEGYWVLKGESHFNGWIREEKRLDHESAELDILCTHIKKGSVVIDIGANIGSHTCRYLQAVGTEGMVVAYEPHPVHYECLIRNCPAASCFNVAVTDKITTTRLIEYPLNTGASHLSENPTTWTSFEVKTTTLDEDFTHRIRDQRPVSFIKIDTEGCEPEVLRGGAKLVARWRPMIYLEVNHHALSMRGRTARDIRHFLNNNRYLWNFIWGGDWTTHQVDILCTPL